MARWRKTDPATSKDAALSVTEQTVTQTQAAILTLLKERSMTDEQLLLHYTRGTMEGRFAPASSSGIRSRRSELANLGLVVIVGEAKTFSGRRANIWSAKVEVTNG